MKMREQLNCSMGRIFLEKLPNTRDLGGIRTTEGKMILPKKLIRSGTLYEATKRDIEILADGFGLGTVIHFRTEAERRQKPDPVIPGVVNIFNPILDEETVGITFEEEEGRHEFQGIINHAASLSGKPHQYINKLYENLVLSQYAASQYGRFFDHLLEADERAVLWHCSAGKDRVGIGTALLLSALSVERRIVVDNFTETNTYVMEGAQKIASYAEQETKDQELAHCVRVLLTVSEDYILHAFSAIEKTFGTVEEYLEKRIGLTHEKREKLKQKYLTAQI